MRQRRRRTYLPHPATLENHLAALAAQIPAGRVKALPLAVDHAIYHPDEEDGDGEIRKRLAVPENYVLYVGSLSGRKNVLPLVQAMEAFNMRHRGSEPVTLLMAW